MHMTEPLFGSASPVWTGIPSPVFGWFQTPSSLGPRSAPGFDLPIPTNSYAFGGAPIVTAPALLGAVAIKRGQSSGPTNDQEIEDFLYDALELLTGTHEVEVRCEGGRVTLSGSVPHKRLKRDIGEIAWAIPTVNDVQNTVAIATRRRVRSSGRDTEQPSSTSARKTA
jgi:hypothetical protein